MVPRDGFEPPPSAYEADEPTKTLTRRERSTTELRWHGAPGRNRTCDLSVGALYR